MDSAELEEAIGELELRVERLRALYDQYFMGLEKIEPAVQRKDVDRRMWLLRREQIRNTALRFKFNTIIQRYNTFQQYWMRVCREIENGTYKRDVRRAAKRFGTEVLTIAAKRRFGKMLDRDKAELQADKLSAQQKVASAGFGVIEAVPQPSVSFAESNNLDELDWDSSHSGVAASVGGRPVAGSPRRAPKLDELDDVGDVFAVQKPPSPAAISSVRSDTDHSFGQLDDLFGDSEDEEDQTQPQLRASLTEITSTGVGTRPVPSTPMRSSASVARPMPHVPPRVSAPMPPVPQRPGVPPRPSTPGHAQPVPRPGAAGAMPPVPQGITVPGRVPVRPSQPGVSAAPPEGVLPVVRPANPAAQPVLNRPSTPQAPVPPPIARPPVPQRPSTVQVPPVAQGLHRPSTVQAPQPPSQALRSAAQVPAAPAQQPRPTPPTRLSVPEPPAARPTPTNGGASESLSDDRVSEIYRRYVQAKRACHESTSGITERALAQTLRASADKLRSTHGREVDFDVVIKEGRAVLKPVVKG